MIVQPWLLMGQVNASSLPMCSPAQTWKPVLSHGKGRGGLQPATELGTAALPAAAMVQHMVQQRSFCKPSLGAPASHISWLATSPFWLHFLFHGSVWQSQPGCTHTHRVKQLLPCLIYSCHPLIYKFHDAIKIQTLSFVLQDLLFTGPTLCYAGDSPPTRSSPSSRAACGLWSQYCLGN